MPDSKSTFCSRTTNHRFDVTSWLLVAALLVVTCGCKMRANQHNAAGLQAYQAGQVSQAINEFQRALNVDPQNANALYNLGASYAKLGKESRNVTWIEQAEQLFRQAISVDSQHVQAHRGLSALLIESGQEKFAFDLLDQWRLRNPSSTEPLIELARLYQEYGDQRRASDLLTDALKLNSNDTRALKALGHVRETQGQYKLALENYLSVIQLDPEQVDLFPKVAALQVQLAKNPSQTPSNQASPRYGSATPYKTR